LACELEVLLSSDEAPERGRRGPSRSKHRDILDGALDLFLEHGFAATTIEGVADRARVSKQTVYSHFGDKETLFRELIDREVGRRGMPTHPLAETMPDSIDLESDLRTYARWHLRLVMTPHLLALRRRLIGEAARFPALARSWYDNGPRRSIELFAGWFEALHERGLLHAPDPVVAGEAFNWLVLSRPLNAAMAFAWDEPDQALDAHADDAVRMFLAAHAVRTIDTPPRQAPR
jgi:TetR/AcrR family transcriptional repressor of mexJK operon